MEKKVLPQKEVLFSWEKAEAHDPMIYFLAIEDSRGKTCTGIYIRELSWTYPRIQKASYFIGSENLPALVPGENYTAN